MSTLCSPWLHLFQFLNTRTITSVAVSRKRRLSDPSSPGCEIWRVAFDADHDIQNKKSMSGVKRYQISSDDIVAWSNRTENSNRLMRHEVESLEKTYARLSNGITMLKMSDSILSDFEKRSILLADSGVLNAEKVKAKPPPNNAQGRPSQEQLQRVHDVLGDTVWIRFLSFYPNIYRQIILIHYSSYQSSLFSQWITQFTIRMYIL